MGAPATRFTAGVHWASTCYHGNSYWRDRANQNLPKVQERTLRHCSNELCRAVWRPHWPFMWKHLVRPQFATGFQKAPFGRRTISTARPIVKSAVKKLFKRLRYMAKREGRQVVGSPRQNATVLGLWNSYEARSFSSGKASSSSWLRP